MSTASVAGLWTRLTEEDPIGDTANADSSTTVLWTQSQTSGIYVDLRLPKDSPGLSWEAAQNIAKRPAALAGTLNPASVSSLEPYLDVLTRQKSFAGVLDVQAGDTTTDRAALKQDPTLAKLVQDPKAILPLCTCFWRRDIDYQPPTGDLDIGVCASAATVVDGILWLRETGADASYAEDWSRAESTAAGPFMALQLVNENDNGGQDQAPNRMGFWVRAADRFAYAVGRSNDPKAGASAQVHKCVGKSLADAVQELAPTDAKRLEILASYIGVAGRINEAGEWIIRHSLNPELVGCKLVGRSGLTCSQLEADISSSEHVVQSIRLPADKVLRRRWKVMELSEGCTLPITCP